ncbi:hypothetical protein NC651_029106 [Populus alba x Populus x berolinensis]|nr:hypothetical protein NC651_029106 [Populus alba x Populus x berolinensis]
MTIPSQINDWRTILYSHDEHNWRTILYSHDDHEDHQAITHAMITRSWFINQT